MLTKQRPSLEHRNLTFGLQPLCLDASFIPRQYSSLVHTISHAQSNMHLELSISHLLCRKQSLVTLIC